MKKMIVLNHKMYLEYDEIPLYIDKLNKIDTDNSIVVIPSSIYLESFINYCNWGIGIQNVYYESFGEYTGEISPVQVKSMGVEYALIGHYERKKYFMEDHSLIKKKLNACMDSNIIPILCFGECGNDMSKTLDDLLEGIDNINFIVFAYEPLEVNENETIDQIKDDISTIYDYLYEKYKVVPNIIYGGGVKEENISDILKIDKLNGILIGKMSINIDQVERVISNLK